MLANKDVKNPAVWRKTGQPETERPALGKHVMKTDENEGGIHKINSNGDDTNASHYLKNEGVSTIAQDRRASIAKNRKDSYFVAGRMPAKEPNPPKADQNAIGTKNNRMGDALGLGLLGKPNNQPLISNENIEETTNGRLPDINKSRSLNNNSKWQKDIDKNVKSDAEDNEKMTISITWNQGQGSYSSRVEFPPVSLGKDTTDMSSQNMKSDILNRRKQANGKNFLTLDTVASDSTLISPFSVADRAKDGKKSYKKATENNKDFSANQLEKPDNIFALERPSNPASLHSLKSENKTSRSCFLVSNKDDEEMRRFSVCSKFFADETISHKQLLTEAYNMKTFRLTNNFTFSFFDLPAIYEEQYKKLQNSVNVVGKRRTGGAQFSKPFKKRTVNQGVAARADK